MVVERRLEYGFGGYRVPVVVPRAARSNRGRGLIRKKGGNSHIQAFEILASVAGKILQGGEGSTPSFAVPKEEDQGHVVKGDDEGELSNPDEKTSPSETALNSYPLHEFLPAQQSYSHKGSSSSYNFDHDAENLAERTNRTISDKLDGWQLYQGQGESLQTEIKPEAKVKSAESGTFEDKMEIDMNIPACASPENNSTKPSLFKNCIGLGCFSGQTKVASRDDDDENASGCSQHVQQQQQQSCNGVQKTRNSSVLRHWRVSSNSKIGGFFRNDGKTSKGTSCSNNQQKTQKIVPFKKRKFFACDDASVCDDIFTSPNKKTNDDSCGSASGTSSSVSGQDTPPNSRDCNVKLSIKSFKVPELFIEIPATATVGSLKRMVMEAVSAVLGDGLHVGILVQGKKVRDDSKTLLQTGISQDDKHNSLGFVLEPRRSQISSSPSCAQSPSFLLSRSANGGPSRHASLKLQQAGGSSASPVSSEIDFGRTIGNSNPSRVLSLGDGHRSNDRAASLSDSKALVTVPAVRMDHALAVVPFHRKSGQPELGQRRMRRPFSVSEVEALVQAVEKLGTGRWRDVKLRAFDNVHHRTYVDLKDKWKTLVHTARISPQQRRGEPVPQELLDRVLAAHAYWSQQQPKHHPKSTV
ncbi:Telomere repeat-binding protein 2 [Linum grandiflorum]